MLIEFRVANYRSIREEQTLSLVASGADKELPGNCIEEGLIGMKGMSFLRGAAIYGHNASGKSNVFMAIQFLLDFINNSAMGLKPGDPTGVEPFKLDVDSISKPSKFEITFVADKVRYLFGVSLTRERIVEEYLVAYPKGFPQNWYRRYYIPESGSYAWDKPSPSFKADDDLKAKVRENTLFLSVGPLFNDPQLTPVYNWFKSSIRLLKLNGEAGLNPNFTAQWLQQGKDADKIVSLMKNADLAIVDAKVQEQDVDFSVLKVSLYHEAKQAQPVELNFAHEESAGTRRLFALAGPWMDILEHGYFVLIDEIETSLHPILVKELVRMMMNPVINTKGAQIVFTTHSPSLLDTNVLRRDQIWFTEKDSSGATTLYPLTDFQPRKGEAVAKGYLAGRYGAVPFRGSDPDF